jgi:hypothetical protein
MLKKGLVMLLIWMALCQVATAAGSACTAVTYKNENLRYIVWSWTSDDTTGAVTCTGKGIVSGVNGVILAVNFKSVSGVEPTTAYDVTILNAGSENILYDYQTGTNIGADIPSALTSTAQRRTPYNYDITTKALYNETLTPAVTNAGNSKQGIIELILY